METKESPYYLGNREQPPTILQIKTSSRVVTLELPWDVDGEDLCDAFSTACIGIGFSPEGIAQSMYEFGETHRQQDNENEE